MRSIDWVEKASADNALATATRAAAGEGRRHVVTKVLASFSAAATKLLQLKHGAVVVFEHYVVNSEVVEIPEGLRNAGNNEAVSAELAASGGAGTIGKVNLCGYTI